MLSSLKQISMTRWQICMLQGKVKMRNNLIVQFDSDNLVYNRYDLIFDSYEKQVYTYEGKQYVFMVHKENGTAYINLWDKKLPQDIFEELINNILASGNVVRVSLIRCKNNYKDLLEETNDIRVPIPCSVKELMGRLKSKHVYNLNREKGQIEKNLGTITVIHYKRQEITDYVVKLYFLWKRASHGIEYGMSPKGYLDAYYITDAITVAAGGTVIGVAFYCVVKDIAYFENFSFDWKYAKFSAGYITYELLLEQLVAQNINWFYLGGGEYKYKKRFGAVESTAYSGHIYSEAVLKKANDDLKEIGINKVVIYGLGKYGHEFIRLYKAGVLNITLAGVFDRNEQEIADIRTYIVGDGEYPCADAAIITMKNKNEEVESFLKGKYRHVIYMNDLLKE